MRSEMEELRSEVKSNMAAVMDRGEFVHLKIHILTIDALNTICAIVYILILYE